MPNRRSILLGSIYTSKNCGDFKIVAYLPNRRFSIQFLKTKSIVDVNGVNVTKGEVKDPYLPTVCGIGYMGKLHGQGKSHPLYRIWMAMMHRCYDKKVQKRQPAYIGCTVDKRWHNFTNFVTDVSKMLNVGNLKYQFDKDWIKPGNKVYTAKRCAFIHKDLNVISPQIIDSVVYYNNRHQVRVCGYHKTFKHESDALQFMRKIMFRKMKALYLKYKGVLDPSVVRTLKSRALHYKEQYQCHA